ncbi:MAG: sigma-54 dependent transcriptional regulator [Ramlibacter sp.]
MRELKVAVIAAGRHRSWRDEWCHDIGTPSGLTLHPAELSTATGAPGQPRGATVLGIVDPAGVPETRVPRFDAVLVLVNPDTVPWARETLPRLRTTGTSTVLIARSLRTGATRELLGKGAVDFLAANCTSEELVLRLSRLCRNPANAARLNPPAFGPAAPARHPTLAGLIGSSPIFLQQLDRIPVLAGCDAGVLILGETGTGKELCAQAVHYLSARAAHPWVAVNCGALPPDLVESELFGHVRGAFTHAHENRVGLVAQASGGTLFLDEVDSMPALVQVKLLRFLQDKEFRPVGSSRVQRADVRVIAASNVNLAQLAAGGAFRPDLYYRLNVLTLHLPALRERAEDVLPLAEHFVDRFASEFNRPVTTLSAAARRCIVGYAWPGNIRELQHAVERGVLLAPGHEVLADDLGIDTAGAGGGPQGDTDSFQSAKARAVELFERAYIERLLARCGGNITHAADAAAKNRRAFWQLMRKHGIDSGKYRGST